MSNNLLVITTDDQRYDELAYMPNTRLLIGGEGTTFTNCRANVPLCTPSRSGIITGQYSKDHGVLDNGGNLTSTQNGASVFVALNNAGYRVGAIGKIVSGLYGAAVKPGFDFWRALRGDSGSGYGVYDPTGYTVFDGASTFAPGIQQDYYLTGQALDFIRAGGGDPWCLWFCPTQPHWPFLDPPNHTTEWEYRDFPMTLEADVSDKPSWIQALTAPTAGELAEAQAEQRSRLRELRSVDDSIGALVAAIQATGQDDTTIIFCTDNGNMLGEHRILGPVGARAGTKNQVYDPALRSPLLARGPTFRRGRVTAPTTLQDVTATMLDVANVAALTADQAGISLADIAANPSAYAAREILHFRKNQGGGDTVPTADGISTLTRGLWRYQGTSGTDQFEMYDRDTDPDEHTNVANVPGRLAERNALEAKLDALLA
jgi:arylsulfatase A-like enzyme